MFCPTFEKFRRACKDRVVVRLRRYINTDITRLTASVCICMSTSPFLQALWRVFNQPESAPSEVANESLQVAKLTIILSLICVRSVNLRSD
jgi:hypothetical protein